MKLKYVTKLYSAKYPIHNSFDMIESGRDEGNIIINLPNLNDSDGYAGYTKSIVVTVPANLTVETF